MATKKKKDAMEGFKKGSPVLCRCTQAGVHAGILAKDWDGSASVFLEGGRWLWAWRIKSGQPVFLNGLARHGIDHAGSQVGTAVDIGLTEVCEVIPMTPEAWESVNSAPEVVRES